MKERAKKHIAEKTLAEKTLKEILEGNLPLTKDFIFNSVFDLRKIASAKEFETLISNAGQEQITAASELQGCVKVDLDKNSRNIKFSLFYTNIQSDSQASLYSSCFADIIALTYAALGLEMPSLSRFAFIKEGPGRPGPASASGAKDFKEFANFKNEINAVITQKDEE